MNETNGSRSSSPRRLGRVVIAVALGTVAVATIRVGVELIPQNPFVGLFLLVATTGLTITGLLLAGRRTGRPGTHEKTRNENR